MKVVFDLSEVLLPGLIGVEDKLETKVGKPKDMIAKALGSHPYHEINNNLEQLLKSEISYEEYREGFLIDLGLSKEYQEVFDHECLRMFDFPYSHTNELVEKLAKSCELFLLSDHCERWAEYIQNKHEFFKFFDGILWSYEVGATKKSDIPFKALCEKYDLNPIECLFVDDNRANISVASEVGFKTLLFSGKDSINEIYEALGLM